MTLTITMKQHDTRPIQNIALFSPDPNDITRTVVTDLTLASSVKINAAAQSGGDIFSSPLAFAAPRTTGVVVWTPASTDTDVKGTYNAEIEITWSDGGIQTFPNDSFFTVNIVGDVG